MKNIYSVSQINAYIRRMFSSDYALNHIYIKGEVSNCKYHSSGHIYFSIKDARSSLACIMFANARKNGLKFQMQDGQTVVVGGNINVFERDGTYQLYASEIILDGIGALYEEYERLKMALYEEGLFDHEIKQPIPKNPKKVGIVTAKTGAAIRDIVSVAKRRNPYVQLILYPALVQGKGAKESIVKGIRTLDAMGLDVLIVGRGGGSIEDLWAFNEEEVAQAIFECATPVISAVGHETDVTIADYVADLRAPTPSAAAELAVFDYRQFQADLGGLREAMVQAEVRRLAGEKGRLEQYRLRLKVKDPVRQLNDRRMRIMKLEEDLEEAVRKKLLDRKHRLEILAGRLQGLSPLEKISGGYGFLMDGQGKRVVSVSQIKPGDALEIRVRDGRIQARAEAAERFSDF